MRIVVTGCSRGLGRALASRLVADGHEVFGLVRRGGRVPDGVVSHTVDLEDPGSVMRAEFLLEGPIDAVVHNAGLWIDRLEFTRDGYERMWAVHVLGPLLLTEVLLPTLRSQTRIVFVGCRSYARGRLDQEATTGGAGYRRSKLGQAALALAWANRLAEYGVTVNVALPGSMRTHLGARHTGAVPRMTWGATRAFASPPEVGAERIIRTLTDPALVRTTGSILQGSTPKPLAAALRNVDRDSFFGKLRARLGLSPWEPVRPQGDGNTPSASHRAREERSTPSASAQHSR